MDTIRRLKEEGLTTVVLTHETDLAGEIGDTISVMTAGRMSVPMPVADFLYSLEAATGAMIPEFILTVKKIEASGVKVPGRPHIVGDVARALATALGLEDD